MRLILWVCLALGVLWGGYWFVGSNAAQHGVLRLFETASAQGITASNRGVSVSGFPNRFDLTVTAPHLADPVSGWGWQASFAQVFSMTWKPWHLIAALPNDQEIDAPGQKIALQSSRMMGSLLLQPSTDLTLEEAVVEAEGLAVQSDQGWHFGAAKAVLALARDATQQNTQHVGVELTNVAPDSSLTTLLPALGATVQTVHLDATLMLTAPLDRHAGEVLPKLMGVRLADFHANWGSLKIAAQGVVEAGVDGVAQGKIDFRIEDWQEIPKLVVALGLVRPEMGQTIERGLNVLAQSGSDPKVLILPLTFAEGRMNLGPLPLGPAPLLHQ